MEFIPNKQYEVWGKYTTTKMTPKEVGEANENCEFLFPGGYKDFEHLKVSLEYLTSSLDNNGSAIIFMVDKELDTKKVDDLLPTIDILSINCK